MTSLRCSCGTRNKFRADQPGVLLQCRGPSCGRLYLWDERGALRPATEWEVDYFRAGPLGRLAMRFARWSARHRVAAT